MASRVHTREQHMTVYPIKNETLGTASQKLWSDICSGDSWWYLGQQRLRVRVMIGSLVRGRVRIDDLGLGLRLTLLFITRAIVVGVNVHSTKQLCRFAIIQLHTKFERNPSWNIACRMHTRHSPAQWGVELTMLHFHTNMKKKSGEKCGRQSAHRTSTKICPCHLDPIKDGTLGSAS